MSVVTMSSHHHLFRRRARSPKFVETVEPHPTHSTTTVLAKISPNPSITPFTNGKNMLIDSEETSAQKRVLTGNEPSNTARVAEAAGAERAAGVVVVVVVVVGAAGA